MTQLSSTDVRRARSTTAFLAVLAGCSGLAAGDVVYDNSVTPAGGIDVLLQQDAGSSTEHGNQVRLAGTARRVTRLRTIVRILDSGPAQLELQARFYANDGGGGEPQTLLWDSGAREVLIDSGANFPVDFSVPDVEVPDTFTWTMSVISRQGNQAAFGPALYGPPAIGDVQSGVWVLGPDGVWSLIDNGRDPFGARIDAGDSCDPCDANCDGAIDAFDIEPFIDVLFGGGQPCSACAADANGDGLRDAFDIEPFIACLFGP